MVFNGASRSEGSKTYQITCNGALSRTVEAGTFQTYVGVIMALQQVNTLETASGTKIPYFLEEGKIGNVTFVMPAEDVIFTYGSSLPGIE